MKEIAHRIDEDHSRPTPRQGMLKSLRSQRKIKAESEGVPLDAAEPFGETLGIAVLAARADKRAARYGVPRRVSPFNWCIAHVGHSYSRSARLIEAGALNHKHLLYGIPAWRALLFDRDSPYIFHMKRTGTLLFAFAGGLYVAYPALDAFDILPYAPGDPPVSAVAAGTTGDTGDTGALWDTVLDNRIGNRPPFIVTVSDT